MVNKIVLSLTPKGTSGTGDANIVVEMCASLDKLWWHNHTLEDDVHNIRQLQQKVNPLGEVELLKHQPFSDKIWGAHIPEVFKSSSLAKFDGCKNLYEHVVSINTQRPSYEQQTLYNVSCYRAPLGMPPSYGTWFFPAPLLTAFESG